MTIGLEKHSQPDDQKCLVICIRSTNLELGPSYSYQALRFVHGQETLVITVSPVQEACLCDIGPLHSRIAAHGITFSPATCTKG